MAFPDDPNREDLSAVIEGYLAGARGGPDRRLLLRIDAAVGEVGAEVLRRGDADELDRLARRVVRDARHAPSHASVLATLGVLSHYATGRAAPAAPSTPTSAMLALGGQLSVWLERIVVIAFVLVAIGLALALA
jgi:hypothetical protein